MEALWYVCMGPGPCAWARTEADCQGRNLLIALNWAQALVHVHLHKWEL